MSGTGTGFTDFSQPFGQDEPGPVSAFTTTITTPTLPSVSGGSDAVVDFGAVALADDSTDDGEVTLPIDENDPRLTSEEIEVNYEADAYAAPPPPPDGKYRVKLKQIDVNGPNSQKVRYAPTKPRKDGAVGFQTALEATIQDPSGKYDGIKLYDYRVNTIANKRKGGAIPVVHIMRCLKVQLPSKLSPKGLMDTFLKATAGEPELMIELTWEGQADQGDSERYKAAGKYAPSVLGMRHFPQKKDGTHETEVEKVVTDFGTTEKLILKARATITGYFPLS